MASRIQKEYGVGRVRLGGRILVIRPGALGDTILSLPALRVLRRAVGGDGQVDWVGYPRYLCLALNPLHASSAYSVDRIVFSGLFSEPSSPELDRFLSSYDLVVSWCRDDFGHLGRLTTRLNVPTIQSPPFPAAGSGIHAAEHLLRTVWPETSPRGDWNPPMTQPVLFLSDESQKAGEQVMREYGLQPGRFIAIHPGSGNVQKNWRPVGFSRVAHLVRQAGLEVLVIEGEADGNPVRALLENLDTRPAILRTEDLQVVARVLSQSASYLGNDSGISHLAAASGAPTVALFGPTDPRTWAPRGQVVRVLGLSATTEEVWSAIQEVCS